MAILWQIGIVLGICLLGEGLALVVPLPASVLAMLLLLVALGTGVLKTKQVEKVTDFLMQNMAFFFVPVCVNILSYLDVIGKNFLAILVIALLSTVVTFAATAFTVRLLTRVCGKAPTATEQEVQR